MACTCTDSAVASKRDGNSSYLCMLYLFIYSLITRKMRYTECAQPAVTKSLRTPHKSLFYRCDGPSCFIWALLQMPDQTAVSDKALPLRIVCFLHCVHTHTHTTCLQHRSAFPICLGMSFCCVSSVRGGSIGSREHWIEGWQRCSRGS